MVLLAEHVQPFLYFALAGHLMSHLFLYRITTLVIKEGTHGLLTNEVTEARGKVKIMKCAREHMFPFKTMIFHLYGKLFPDFQSCENHNSFAWNNDFCV